MAVNQPEIMPSSLEAATPTTTEAPSQAPSSIADAFGDPSTSIQPAIPILVPSSSINNIVATSSIDFQQFPLPSSAKSTLTTSTTIYVTPSPVPASESPGEAASTAAEASPTPTLDLAPLSPPTSNTMSASAQAGMGVGITFGVLSVAGATGLYLWRRRRNQRFDRSTRSGRRRGGGLGGFFRMRSPFNSKHDAEWSIESAEQVEIVRGASARSVSTGGSRGDSRGSADGKPSSAAAGAGGTGNEKIGLEVLKIGMRVPDRKPNPALTSNPPVSPGQFPTPPSSRGSASAGAPAPAEGAERKEGKTSSWPLPD